VVPFDTVKQAVCTNTQVLMEDNFLSSLNDAQLRGQSRPSICVIILLTKTTCVAVKYWPETPLQILAGPGSGKTKVSPLRHGYF
jgi:hypothetical protein